MARMKSPWLMPCLPYLRLSAAVSSECKESARRSLGFSAMLGLGGKPVKRRECAAGRSRNCPRDDELTQALSGSGIAQLVTRSGWDNTPIAQGHPTTEANPHPALVLIQVCTRPVAVAYLV